MGPAEQMGQCLQYAMNRFLKSLDISFRRDEKSMRPRVNKIDSRLDKEQKQTGNFYYRN